MTSSTWPTASRTRAFASSSSTSCDSGSCSTPKPPERSSRDRKAARPPKRVPGGAIEEDARARCDEAALIHDATVARDQLIALGPERMSEYDFARAPKVRLDRG